MALIDRQIQNQIVSRGLGDTPVANTGINKTKVSARINLNVAVYEDKLYYPATGVFSREEEIKGWYWDRTHAQVYGELPTFEIKDFIGSHRYIAKDGIPENHYQGAVLDGLELLEVEGVHEWTPVLKTGVYSIDGIDKQLYSNASICKIIENGSLDINGYNQDNITVAIYERDKDYVKKIFREYKENANLYGYSIDEDSIVIANNSSFNIGNSNLTDADDIRISYERLGFKNNNPQEFYIKYFPVSEIDVKLLSNASNGTTTATNVNSEDYTLDKDLGILKITNDSIGAVHVAYTVVPRVDIEIDSNVGFKSKLDLKSHNWKQGNGIIEITSEDRHVAKINLEKALTEYPDSLDYGNATWLLKATALNSKDNPVDEVKITIKSLADNNQEIRFEGNLLENVGETNSSGEVYTRINAPLIDSSSSFFFQGEYPQDGFGIDAELVPNNVNAVLNETLIFEVLKVDPFLGSNGITLDVNWNNRDKRFEIKNNLDSHDYQLFRNAISNSLVTNLTNNSSRCFNTFYNSGFVLKSGTTKKYAIKKITKEHIYLHEIINGTFNKIKLFLKNENTTSLGVERLLYKKDPGNSLQYIPVTASKYLNGRLEFDNLQDANRPSEDIVSGYRIYMPRREKLVAECIDPASGLVIQSAPLDIKLNLSDIYKQVITLNQNILGVANHLSYEPVGNNIYFES